MKRFGVFLALPAIPILAFVIATAVPAAAAPEDTLDTALTELLAANRISGANASWRRDNPNEYARVVAYLDGGTRPAEPLSRLGRGLVLVEDARRELVGDPTTTDTTTTTDPPPPDGETIIRTTQYVCNSAVNIALLRVTMDNGSSDAVQFRSGCTGRITRLEVSGRFADCLKVNPPAPAPHDVVVESGFCRADQPPSAGVHQDCIQAGGGRDFAFTRFVFDCIGGGGGNFFIASFNGGTPQRFTCDGCAFGSRHPNQVRTPSDPASGVSNSRVCQSSSGRPTYSPASGNLGGNTSPAATSPDCTFAELLAFVGG